MSFRNTCPFSSIISFLIDKDSESYILLSSFYKARERSEMTFPVHSKRKWPRHSWNSRLLTHTPGLFPFLTSDGARRPGKSGLEIPWSLACGFRVRGHDSSVAQCRVRVRGVNSQTVRPSVTAASPSRGGKGADLMLQTFRSFRNDPSLTTLSLQGMLLRGKAGRVYKKEMRKGERT